jgi:hypothetical protein
MMESKAKRPSYKSEKAKVYRDSDSEDDEDEMSDYAPPINVMTTRVEAAMGSATYHIPRACSVAADNKPHKVSHLADPQFKGLNKTFNITTLS